jgi:outer membrane cobalamin receptor
MTRYIKYAVLLVAFVAGWGGRAAAQGARPPTAGSAVTAASPSDNASSSATVVIPECVRDLITPTTTAEELALLSQTECIPVYDQRPDKPFDRDTEVRLTGEQLAARGAVDLATALALLPDVTVRDGGRGGQIIDIRGARKGEVAITIDGVLVSDPYYGTFDLTSIPITDIVQIRVATTPQSPIDGPGGPGGVIEVSTRDAIGPQLVVARLEGDTLPSAGVTATARTMISGHTAMRLSLGDQFGGHEFTLLNGRESIGNDDHDANGSLRLEYRDGDARVAGDLFVDTRHYIAPPNDNQQFFLDVDKETTTRADIKADDKIDGFQIQGEAGIQYLHRISREFTDPTEKDESSLEDLTGWRQSAFALVTRPIDKEWRWAASTTVIHETCDVGTQFVSTTNCHQALIEPAADLQYEHRTIRVDGSVGEAIPVFIGAPPYAEGKLIARWRPMFGHLELIGTIGRKGRVPSLRERNEPGDGNPKLGPELADTFEFRAIEHINDRVHVEVAPYYRYASGIIVTAPVQDPTNPLFGKLINLGITQFWGVDVLGRVRILPIVEVGGGYSYIQVREYGDPNSNDDVVDTHPLNYLPTNKFDAWVQVTPLSRLSAIVRAIYVGSAYGSGNTSGEVLLPGYTTLEATVTWQINTKYLFVLRGEDLTDVRPQLMPHVYGYGTEVYAIFQGTWN